MIKRKLGISLAAFAAALLPAGTAFADVRAGVDAWARGEYPAAVREWQGPAAKGDADAQFNLGQAYKLGRGVKADLAKAEELFGRASAQGHLQASDMYGLLLFQRGERAKAMPYVRAAADRGEPRALYLLGVAHFNGDNVPKDWVRAYALTSMAQQSGIEQAQSALAQMDNYIPIEQRQQGVALSAELASQVEANRARQLAAVDLGATAPPATTPARPAPPPARSAPAPARPVPAGQRPSTAATATEAAAVARAAADNSSRTAGADYARPQTPPVTSPGAKLPTPTVAAAPAPAPRPVPKTTPPAATISQPTASAAPGPWRVQLGAFSVASNASALWNRVKDRPELAGRERLTPVSGRITRLLAGGFASRQAAQSACSRLAAAGFDCLVTQN